MENLLNSKRRNCNCNLLYQIVATFSATLIMVSSGMHHAWPSPSLPILLKENSDIPISPSEGSWIIVVKALGGPFGCIASVILSDRIGRKRSLLMASPFFLITWLAIANTSSVLVLGCARFIAGVSSGLVQSVLPMYVGEIADKNIRGLLCSCIPVGSKIGSLLINIIGIHYSIKMSAMLASIVPALHFLTLCFMPESPRFYILKNKEEKAIASLNKLNKRQNGKIEASKLAADIKVESIRSERFINIFTDKPKKRSLGIILGLMLLQHFSGYFPMTFYCLTIFSDAGEQIQGSTATVIFFFVQLVSSVIGSVLIDSAGRKPLLIGSTIGAGFSLTTAGIYFYLKHKTDLDVSNLSFLPLTALLLYVVAASIGLTIIPVLMMGELFPISVKANAISISNVAFAIFGTLATKFFQITKDGYGLHVPFLVFALCCAVGLIFIIYCVPETKGKTLEEIQIILSQPRSKSSGNNDAELDLNIPLNREL